MLSNCWRSPARKNVLNQYFFPFKATCKWIITNGESDPLKHFCEVYINDVFIFNLAENEYKTNISSLSKGKTCYFLLLILVFFSPSSYTCLFFTFAILGYTWLLCGHFRWSYFRIVI